jgi:hypothetical protein
MAPAPPEDDDEEAPVEVAPPAAVLALLARDEAEDLAPLTAVEALDSKLEAAEPALEATEEALDPAPLNFHVSFPITERG